jgi:Uma2 family endonuclease
MSAVTTLPWGRPLTRHDLHDLPDDGHRYELLDGLLLVSPSPTLRHQRAASRLVLLLGNACPADRELLFAPFDVVLADDTVLQPDILVASASDLEDEGLPLVPHLVVEVLSPSTRRVDLLLKRSRYEAAGIPSYWTVDPEEPSVTVLELVGHRYVETARVVDDQAVEVDHPYPLTVVPRALVE